MQINWSGVMPATTTPFKDDLSIDQATYAEHCRWLVEAGCTGLVPGGSLGEGATLSFDEKVALFEMTVGAAGNNVPVIPGIASLSTAEAVRLAQTAQSVGCSGLMVLPPYVYSTDWREMKAHVSAVIRATSLPCMLYNNPPAYKTDFLPEQIAELAAEHPNLQAVKESSGDVRRVTAIRALLGDRLAVLVGVDDVVIEAVQAGAVGWIAGLVNAFPEESVALFDMAVEARRGGGDRTKLDALYSWFLPLLRMDTVPKFVQLIKLCQSMTCGWSTAVRPPRLPLVGDEHMPALRAIEDALRNRPG